jgi:hypothetical protein
VREGITFVLFAADIPQIAESIGAGALAARDSIVSATGLGQMGAFFAMAIAKSG